VTDRIPRAVDTERALLAASLTLDAAAIYLAGHVPAEAFFHTGYASIARAITDTVNTGQPVDRIAIAAKAAANGAADIIKNDPRLYKLCNDAGTPLNYRIYADLICSLHRRRNLIGLSVDLKEAAEEDLAVEPILERARKELASGHGHPETLLEDVAAALDQTDESLPTMLVRSDGRRLLYREAVNVLQGEPSGGKTTVALIAVRQVLDEGGTVLYLDFEDVIIKVTARARAVGCNRYELVERFHYSRPNINGSEPAAVVELARHVKPDLVVVDGVAESIASLNLDEDEASEVTRWWTALPRALANLGAAILLLDHVTKSKENRGRWARGSGVKLGAADGTVLSVDAPEPFSRKRAGRIRLTVAKDRAGHVGAIGDTAAIIPIRPRDDGIYIDWTVNPPHDSDTDSDEPGGPSIRFELLDSIVDILETFVAEGPLSRNRIADELRGRNIRFDNNSIGGALARLVQQGQIVRLPGPRNSHLHALPNRQQTLEPELTT
jgi:hypothetical protein